MNAEEKTAVVSYVVLPTRAGYEFAFPNETQFVPLMERDRAFRYILNCIDTGCRIELVGFSLSELYQNITDVKSNLAEEIVRLAKKI